MPEQQSPRGLTETQRRALTIIRDAEIQSPTHFGRLLWPESPSWRRIGKCGAYDSSAGVGMRLASGAYLGKLVKAGSIRTSCRSSIGGDLAYRLTGLGRRSLELAARPEGVEV